MRLPAVLVVALACALPALAGRGSAARERARGAIVGVVTDTAGALVGGATVRLDRVGGATLSDEQGRFAIGGLPPGRLGGTVRRLGCIPADFELDLPAATRVEVTVRLVPSPTPLPTVVVDGERRELPLQASGFYDRVRFATGHFLRPEVLDARRDVALSTLLREVPRAP